MSWSRAMPVDDLPPAATRARTLEGERLVFCRLASGEIYAIEDSCSHDDGPLGQGTLVDAQIECPRHGARFDVRTGAAVRMPAAAPIETFPTRIVDGWVEVNLEEEL